MDFFLFAVIVLFVLAACDLMVGVSNDAVNFLNSAVGSRVASRRAIMVVVSLGILAGATFSSGMMEIARKGIFNPERFVLSEIMVIFLAVMITDVILLDLFNTFGMPTSTTVSIVFELLGAAVVMSLIKISAAGASVDELATYINTGKALTIIFGILLSIAVAFTMGVAIQYLSRLVFSFNYQSRLKWWGAVWSGISLTALSYFLVIKGFKGASFVSENFLDWVDSHTGSILLGMLLLWTVVSQLLIWLRVDILRMIVMLGTFSLAMAFAGNDLVNFIGVPVAGFESFRSWSGSNIAADAYGMESLSQPVRTNTGLLLAAGLIMVLTLWRSKKARTVTETEVNLGRQDAGVEHFSPNILAQMIVRMSRVVGQIVAVLIPRRLHRAVDSNFVVPPAATTDPDPPAFDLVRAAVNLTVASILIALATSYKLPLSTTYVSFMVAMGTSLADRAWDWDSAVYRVSGVINVIGGWFLTATVAFSFAGLFSMLIHVARTPAVLVLIGLAGYSVWHSFHIHAQRERRKKDRLQMHRSTRLAYAAAIDETSDGIARSLDGMCRAYHDALEGLFREDVSCIKRARHELDLVEEQNDVVLSNLHHYIQHSDESQAEGSRIFLVLFDITHDNLLSLSSIVRSCKQHVRNCHKPPAQEQIETLTAIRSNVEAYLGEVRRRVEEKDFENIKPALQDKKVLLASLKELFEQHVAAVKEQTYGAKNTELYLRMLLGSKNLASTSGRFLKFYHRRLVPKHKEPTTV